MPEERGSSELLQVKGVQFEMCWVSETVPSEEKKKTSRKKKTGGDRREGVCLRKKVIGRYSTVRVKLNDWCVRFR